jgi:head-tail adaptor
VSLQYDFQSRKARFSTDPGRMDRRVTLQAPAPARDAAGGVLPGWGDIATVSAVRLPQGGSRFYTGEGKHYENTLQYRIRHRPDVEAGARLIEGIQIMEIVGVAELGRRHFLELTVRAVDQPVGDTHARLDAGDTFTFLDAGDGTTILDAGLPAA